MMTLDDFEWEEYGFDHHQLIHKRHNMIAAVIKHFNGWYIQVQRMSPQRVLNIAENIDNLEAAKAIAMIHVNQHIGDYPDANDYSPRAPKLRPKAIPKRVFKMD